MRHFVLVPHEICVVPYGTRKFFLSEMIFNCDAQPSVIAYGDASSLDAKTQFVASYMRREKLLVVLMSLCDAGSI